MPAKDTYHDAVRTALVRDGWTITHDPYTIVFGTDNLFADPGAEKTPNRGAGWTWRRKSPSRSSRSISASGLRDFELALGQFILFEEFRVAYFVFDPDRREILRWIS